MMIISFDYLKIIRFHFPPRYHYHHFPHCQFTHLTSYWK